MRHPVPSLFVPLALLCACGADPSIDAADTTAVADTIDAAEVADATDAADTDTPLDTDAEPAEPRSPWQTFERAIDYPLTQTNPFDPAEVRLDVTFEAPDGSTYTVPAFVYEGFTRALVDDREVLTTTATREWRVRFRPPLDERPTAGAPATWRWRWHAVTPTGDLSSAWDTFEAVPDLAGHGVLRASRDPRYLVFEDESPFFAIGENMGWADTRGTFAFDDWMEKLAAAGGTYLRVWMPSWGMGIEWTGSLGDYGSRLDRAWQLDHVFDKARELGLYVMLTLQNHGPFSDLHASQWDTNPYNARNGGPLTEPTAFFTDPTARELMKRRLRYIAARWGHAQNLLAWELWNEVDLVADPRLPEVKAWHAEMAQELRALDPQDHLVTTSLGGVDVLAAHLNGTIDALPARYDLWSMPELDFTQIHFYAFGTLPFDFVSDLGALVGYLHTFSKPALIGEVGVSAVSGPDTLENDPHGVGFQKSLWSGLFAETFGTGMSWWWDSVVDPESYYVHFRPLADLVSGVRFDREAFVRTSPTVTASAPLRAHALVGRTTVLAWIENPNHQWTGEDPTTFSDASLALGDLASGSWRATWIDPYGASPNTVVTTTPRDGALTLTVPAFARDLALRLDHLP